MVESRFEAPELLAESAAWMIAEMLDHPVEIRDANTMLQFAAQTEVVVAFGERPDDTIDKQIRHALEPLGPSEVRIETTASDDESWRDGWRAFFEASNSVISFGSGHLGRHRPRRACQSSSNLDKPSGQALMKPRGAASKYSNKCSAGERRS